ncbi:hypothetical protein SSX86_025806 [Deinandra increscens subsp. villosa]|uniref:TauD/TfdA-like domain-containing protein n=1 Tax=Deinandra increscens subsp. villosa TaxID=3103831 RepID=A0AAP0CJ97_9ASTR
MASQKPFQEVELPQQKLHDDNVLFPLVLSPNTSTDAIAVELSAFEDAIKAHKPSLESLLLKNGAILFRGFPVMSPSDFNNIVEAFGFPELPYVGGIAPRTQVIGRVYTANESPLDMKIPFHHEMAYVPNPPTKLFFFCEEEPERGGETPIVLSHIVYEKMKERRPDFVRQLEEHGLRYIRLVGENDDPSSYVHNSWKSLYKTDNKIIAQERAAKLGAKLEWTENGARLITNPLPAVRFDEESGRKTWFNNLQANGAPSSEKTSTQNTSLMELGNGDPVHDDVVEDLLKILEEECVAIPWKKGDFLLINNLTVLHGRRPLITPPRRILASVCK